MSLTGYMATRLDEHLDQWRRSVTTLPEAYLRSERRDLGDQPEGAKRVIADLLDAELDRRRGAQRELPL